MKSNFLLGFLLTLNILSPIVIKEVRAESNNNLDTLITTEAQIKSETNSEIPVVDAQRWRKGKFKFPWSEPVMVEDEFEGNYLAVLDRHKLSNKFMGMSSGIISEWSNKHIKVDFYTYVKDGLTNLFTGTQINVIPAKNISIKIGEQIFELTGDNGNFPITEEIIQAMKNTSDSAVKIKVVPVNEGGDGMLGASYGLKETVFDLKQETIDTWKVVYGEKEVVSE